MLLKIERETERDLLLIIILRERRRKERKPRVWVWPVYGKSDISLTVAAVSLNWFSGLCIVTILLLLGLFLCIGDMLKKRVLLS